MRAGRPRSQAQCEQISSNECFAPLHSHAIIEGYVKHHGSSIRLQGRMPFTQDPDRLLGLSVLAVVNWCVSVWQRLVLHTHSGK